jgi:nicotinamidase-related amidase
MPRRALLLIDFFNPLDFEGGEALALPALRAAKRTAALKARLRRAGVPAIYANDNFGQWQSEFSSLVQQCIRLAGAPGAIARLLAPQPGDRSILKPRHSAFYGTPLEFLLEELGSKTLILTGIAADACIMITAHDAHIRKFKVWVPRDCVASERASYTRTTLAHLERTAHAITSTSRARERSSVPKQ